LGGFTFFIEKLKTGLRFDYTLANTLAIENGVLTGEVVGDIIDGQAKQDFLLNTSEALNISLEQTLALGDGANDLPMLSRAGLGIAYRAKPQVQAQADCVFNFTDLSGVLDFLEISADVNT